MSVKETTVCNGFMHVKGFLGSTGKGDGVLYANATISTCTLLDGGHVFNIHHILPWLEFTPYS